MKYISLVCLLLCISEEADARRYKRETYYARHRHNSYEHGRNSSRADSAGSTECSQEAKAFERRAERDFWSDTPVIYYRATGTSVLDAYSGRAPVMNWSADWRVRGEYHQ